MGYGNYSHEAHDALLRSRSNVPVEEVFQQREKLRGLRIVKEPPALRHFTAEVAEI